MSIEMYVDGIRAAGEMLAAARGADLLGAFDFTQAPLPLLPLPLRTCTSSQ